MFAPRSLESEERVVNVGLYGAPRQSGPAIEVTRAIEQFTQQLGDRKVLYSYSYYDEEGFRSLYQKDSYTELRRRYRADRLVKIFHKLHK